MKDPAILALIAGMALPAYALAGETTHELNDQFLGHTLQDVATTLENKGYAIDSTEAEDGELKVDLASGTVNEIESEHDDD